MAVITQLEQDDLMFRHSRDDRSHPSWFHLHVHDQCEILYFLSGEATCLIESTIYPMQPNTMLLMRPMEAHKMNVNCDKPYERIAINFHPDLIRDVDPEGRLLSAFMDRPLGQLNLYRMEEFSAFHPMDFFRAMSRVGLTTQERRTDVLTYLLPLLGQIELAFREKQPTDLELPVSTASKVVDYVNRHLFDDLSLERISDRFFISTSQLERLFKGTTGSSVWDYVRHKRLVSARQRIRAGEAATIACQACGFRDYSSFYRAYKTAFGLSPQQDSRPNP